VREKFRHALKEMNIQMSVLSKEEQALLQQAKVKLENE
jgi:hypothetical protein